VGISDESVTLIVGRAEALVLFEMLANLGFSRVLEMPGPAERLALARLHGVLEKTLVEPFMPNYQTLIEEARSKLSAQSGT
jgi:hypothetical protein